MPVHTIGIAELSTLRDASIVAFVMSQNRTELVRAYILSAVVALVAALGSLLYVETASVKLSVPPARLVANVTLTGGQTSGDLKTQRIQATVTETRTGSASIVLVAPSFATGRVVFSCTRCSTTTIDAGTIVSTAKGLLYATQSAATVTRSHPATVAVQATSTGPSYNTASKTITVINDRSQFPSDLRVANNSAIKGGADVRTGQVIQQSDFDLVRNALATTVTAALVAALNTKTSQMTYAADAQPALNVTSDHKVGDQVGSFKVTMTGTLGATVFSDSDARSLILSAFRARIPAGQQLTADAVDITWQVQQSGPDGAVTVNGTAVGYFAPTVSTNALRTRLRGLTAADARKSIERAVPGSNVEIQISPIVVPFLPLIAEHITITVLVRPITK
jgi:hypothetical protein